MFCPKCSQPQPPEGVRFCPRCGFQVGTVMEIVSREEARDAASRAADGARLPAQKDITTGALLMFAGGAVAALWGFAGTRGPAEVLLPQSYFILGLTLVFLLTLFHPLLRGLEGTFSGAGAAPHTPRRRDGINLGALLMFAGTLKAMLATSYMHPGPERGVTTLFIMAGMLLLLLLLRPLLRAAHRLFFKAEGRAADASDAPTARLDPAPNVSALPHARAIPVNGFTAAGADTGEMLNPPSVTEGTTRKL